MSALPLLAGYAPDAPLGVRDGRTLRAGAFCAAARSLAGRLPANHPVLLLCEDRVGFALGFAAALLRGTTVLLPPSRASHALERIVRNSTPACALVDHVGETALLPEIVVDPWQRCENEDPIPAIDADHVAAMVHTSGTTGDPQPHAKTWASLVRGARALRDRVGFEPGAAVVGAVPPQHMWGLEATVMLPLQNGGVVHGGLPLLPGDVVAALDTVDAPRWLVVTPLHIRSCVRSRAHLPALKAVLTAASALDRDLAVPFEEATRAPLIEIYGSTETGGIATRRPAHETAFTSFDGVRVETCAEGITVSGGHVGDDIVLRDRAVVHADGRFTLSGRDSDLVKIGGKRASLAMLNRTLMSVAGVVDAAFVIVDDVAAGQRLAALAVARGTTREAIVAALREQLDSVFVPRPLHLVASLPRNALGKLADARLREIVTALSVAPSGCEERSRVREVEIPATHPALPGHFPGRPIVPAAWLLTLVTAACREAWDTRAPLKLERARFRAPLVPGATLRIELERRDAGSIAFVCTHDHVRIADGTLVTESGNR